MRKQMQKGFTLIELMVVIVIIGILAAIAIPSYLDNANRAKVTEGINLIAPVKASIAEAYIGLGTMPANAAAAGIGVPASYETVIVNTITYGRPSSTTATITIAYKAFAAGVSSGATLQFTGVGSPAKGVVWACKNSATTVGTGSPPLTIPASASTLPEKYKPANCRG